jgi:hypothetical protein
MARTSPLTGGTNNAQTTSEDLAAIATDFISDGVVGAVASTVGVAPMTGGLSLNAQSTPDRTTALGAGIAYVTATPTSQGSQRLRVKIDAQNITHSTNVTGGTRYDWIYIKVDPALAANPAADMSTTGTVYVSRSTSSTTDNGTPPAFGYHIHTVTLANAYPNIVNGNIADTRVPAGIGSLNQTSWASWTPTWTGLTVGNGTVSAKYQQNGKTVAFRVSVLFGSTTTITSAIRFSPPVVPVNINAGSSLLNYTFIVGNAVLKDDSTGTAYPGGCYFESTTALTIDPYGAGSAYLIGVGTTAAIPFPWATGDVASATGTYEAA